MLKIDSLGDRDLDDVFALSAAEGWNQTVADWARLTLIDAAGCFVARDGECVAGTAAVTTYGDTLAWIGMVIVQPAYRGRGVGAALMRHALHYARERRVEVVKLDATPAGQPLYESLGFTAEARLDRWQGLASRVIGADPYFESDDMAEISALDAAAYGADRSRLLDALVHDSIGHPLVSRSDGGRPAGYSLARRGRVAIYLGPIIASAASTATDLFHATLARHAGAEVCLDHHVGSHLQASVLEDCGLTRRRSLLRMRLGPYQSPGSPPSVCASAGPELG